MVVIEGTTERIPLEIAPETAGRADRYTITGSNPLTAKMVPPNAPGSFYADHRWDCPGYNAGKL
jgi:hypothetical protein